MIGNARRWRVLAGGIAAGVAGVVGIAGATASAQPTYPQPSVPIPPTVTQTVTVAPAAAPVASSPTVGQAGLLPGSAAVPGTVALPGTAALPGAAPVAPIAQAVAPAVPAITPATSGTLREFFTAKNVKLEPQVANGFTALNIVLPMPAGWSQVPDPNVPDAFAVIADRNSGDLYTPNAQVVVYKLIGDFDPKEAISHGLVDSQQLPGWRSINASLAEFNGFPSALIEGSYRSTEQMLNTSRRHVLAASGQDRYLVSLTVTAGAGNQGAPTAADATDAIVTGFRVAAPGTAASPAAAAAASPAAPAAPAAPAVLPAPPRTPAVSALAG
ncbi:LpqN/LpqT family lipoprotein [Mycobacterium sp. CPCC 205372]|uniref:LpqN/LpqT family lipoprotein n=3 Tax=Mycobacteriaceae TaxID=1762 RepID=A0ABT4PUM7_9MYCO|nr:LpqN/LpqT family lipoprotein [Mycobacterium hippophais]MCZ8380266.1 LpqN/LpqT family lipoprotein [Mycobacterium hippophais]